MAVALTQRLRHRVLAALGCAACLLPAWAWALGAAAPFTPPAAPHAAASAAGEGNGEADAAAAAPVAQGLSGVRLGSKPMALIDGQWLAPGATVRGARLVAVHADAVQLRGPSGEVRRLELSPQIELRRLGPTPTPRDAATAARPPQARQP